jgi:hypothetical protein
MTALPEGRQTRGAVTAASGATVRRCKIPAQENAAQAGTTGSPGCLQSKQGDDIRFLCY